MEIAVWKEMSLKLMSSKRVLLMLMTSCDAVGRASHYKVSSHTKLFKEASAAAHTIEMHL